MNAPLLFCRGRRLPIGQRIGRGGEGEIYAIDDNSGQAVKIYHQPDVEREAKVRAFIAARFSDKCLQVTFPFDIVSGHDGRFVGFTMRRVTDHQPIHELIGPASRRKRFPRADWRFLIRTAINLARIVATVHSAGAIIGDINSAGFLVSQNALVTLIDADSFQASAFRCRVGMPEYTPPELQGISLSDVDRDANHDAFGLAVILFQLLALGWHPFAGVVKGRTADLPGAIAQRRFAFSVLRDVDAAPPPAALKLDDLPRGIMLLFEVAFGPGDDRRPSAEDWIRELLHLESSLLSCVASPNHHIARAEVPCPWCRIEATTKMAIFGTGRLAPTPTSLQLTTELHRQVRKATDYAKDRASETMKPPCYLPNAQPSSIAKCLRLNSDRTQFQLWLSLNFQSSDAKLLRSMIDRYAKAETVASTATDSWRKNLGVWDVHAACDRLHRNLVRLDAVKRQKPRLVAKRIALEVAKKVAETLRKSTIATVAIAGVGPGLRANLARSGIHSAFDVSRAAFEAVPGLATKRAFALMVWRESLTVEAERAVTRTRQFMDSTATLVIESLEREIAQMERALHSESVGLVRRATTLEDAARRPDVLLAAALQERDQAHADLIHLALDPGTAMKLRARHVVPAAAPTPPARRQRKMPSCLKCGNPMVKRWASTVSATSSTFLGCSAYPKCTATRPVGKRRTKP